MEGWDPKSKEHQYWSDGNRKRFLWQRLKRQGQANVGRDPGGNDTAEAK